MSRGLLQGVHWTAYFVRGQCPVQAAGQKLTVQAQLLAAPQACCREVKTCISLREAGQKALLSHAAGYSLIAQAHNSSLQTCRSQSYCDMH